MNMEDTRKPDMQVAHTSVNSHTFVILPPTLLSCLNGETKTLSEGHLKKEKRGRGNSVQTHKDIDEWLLAIASGVSLAQATSGGFFHFRRVAEVEKSTVGLCKLNS